MTPAFAVGLLLLHGPDGREIYINPETVTTMRAAPHDKNKHFPDEARCMLNTNDGKFIAVIESCEEIRKLMK
jgi:uncharacterized protein YlzI (FlbEa/FlbD family)